MRDRGRVEDVTNDPANISRGMAEPFCQPATFFDTRCGGRVLGAWFSG